MKYQIYGVRNVNLCDRESYVEPCGVLYIHELHAKLALLPWCDSILTARYQHLATSSVHMSRGAHKLGIFGYGHRGCHPKSSLL